MDTSSRFTAETAGPAGRTGGIATQSRRRDREALRQAVTAAAVEAVWDANDALTIVADALRILAGDV